MATVFLFFNEESSFLIKCLHNFCAVYMNCKSVETKSYTQDSFHAQKKENIFLVDVKNSVWIDNSIDRLSIIHSSIGNYRQLYMQLCNYSTM